MSRTADGQELRKALNYAESDGMCGMHFSQFMITDGALWEGLEHSFELEVTAGFEPAQNSFANCPLSHLGTSPSSCFYSRESNLVNLHFRD